MKLNPIINTFSASCYKFQQQTLIFPIQKMNKRLLTIQVLKEKMVNMQEQLHKLQKQQKTPTTRFQKTKEHSTSPIRRTSSDKRYKSPTFWTSNPILGDRNSYYNQKSISPAKKVTRNVSFKSKSPLIQKIKKDVDLSFYQSAPQQEKQNINQHDSIKQLSKGDFKKTDSKMIVELFRDFPKVEKKRTYQFPKKDPILHPEPSKLSSKKITHPVPRSPSNMFIQNPNSNPNLYFSSNQAVTLSPKAVNNRNKSPGVRLALSNSLENLEGMKKSPKSNKKHYNKYFQENFESKWNLQW